MLRKTMIIFPAALVAAMPFAAMAETMSPSELQMFNGATLSLQQAGDAALAAQQGKLAEVSFDDEQNGRAAWEAVVISADGKSWTMMIDANNGEVFAKALSSAMDDHQDNADEQDDDDQDGETNDG